MESVVASFESTVDDALGPLDAGSLLLVSVSGGADSTALLLALAALRQKRHFKLRCVHVDHGLRPAVETAADRRAVLALCADLRVSCRIAAVPRGRIAATAKAEGIGLEAAARKFRRRVWKRELRRTGAALLAVGHTRDDALETALLRFLRGSGPAGLALMPVRRSPILRPLLNLTRSDVLAYLSARGVSYRTDSTNADTAFLRNRIRALLVPLLDERFSGWRGAVPAGADTQRRLADFLKTESDRRIRWEYFEDPPGTVGLRCAADSFYPQAAILREEALYAGINRLRGELRRRARGLPAADAPRRASAPPRRAALRRFAAGTLATLDLGGLRLERRGPWVRLAAAVPLERSFALLIRGPGAYALAGGLLRVEADAGAVDPADDSGFSAEPPIVVRRPFPEDRIRSGGRLRRLGEVLDRTERSRYTDSVVAEDRAGIAAVVNPRRDAPESVVRRDSSGAAATSGPYLRVYWQPAHETGYSLSRG